MDGCNVCGNSAAPSFILGMDPLTNTLVDAKKGVFRLRYITEITNDIISYCKELGKLVELRHFNGLKGNFEIIEAGNTWRLLICRKLNLCHILFAAMSLRSHYAAAYMSLIRCSIRQSLPILKLSKNRKRNSGLSRSDITYMLCTCAKIA
jgi:hypothetical protein